MANKAKKGSLGGLAIGIAALVMTIAIIILVLAYFQNTAEPQIQSLNNTQAQESADQAFNLSWSGLKLLAIGIIVVVGFGLLRVMRG